MKYNNSIIEEGAIIGENVKIGPYCYIRSNVTIKNDCVLVANVSIGAAPQYKGGKNIGGKIVIDSGTEIREFVTINSPVKELTYVGVECLLMANCHIPHDCFMDDHSVLVVGAALGGYAHVGKHCQIGLNASLHQFSDLGDYCMVGAGSFFKGKSPGGIIWAGIPAKPLKVNIIGINKYASDFEKSDIIIKATKYIDEML